jgi:hypothetical protein
MVGRSAKSMADQTGLEWGRIDASLGQESTANSSRRLEDSMDAKFHERGFGMGMVPTGNKRKNDSEHKQWHVGNIIQVWSCGNLENLGC